MRISTVVGSGPFVPVEEAVEVVGKFNSIPGAIVISIDDVEIVGTDLWDEIDDHWALFVQGVDEAIRTGSGNAHWPDQPITLSFSVFDSGSTPHIHMCLLVRDDQKPGAEAYASVGSFASEVAHAARAFFHTYERLDPVRFKGRFDYHHRLIDRWELDGFVDSRPEDST